MNCLKEKIDERIVVLERILKEKSKDLDKAPEGIVNFAHSGNRVQYYYKNNSKDNKRRYIKKKDVSLVSKLCQKDYDEKVIEIAEKEYMRLKSIQNLYQNGICEDIYNHLNPDRKPFVSPITLSDDEFVVKWMQQEYVPKGFALDMPEYYTDNGERVRSKSEILIANALKKHNIPYRYEAPIYISGLGTIYPDFTVLNVKQRKEYYWEHMGRMDDFDYIEKALQRIDAYEKNDIFPGDKLLLTHETLKNPINPRNIEKIIYKYLK